jgi:hypothetical protein
MKVENIKKVIGFGFELGQALVDASKKESSVAKVVSLLKLGDDVLVLLGTDFSALKAEFKDLTAEELDEIGVYVKAKFKLDDADKEQKIEMALDVAIELLKVAEKAMELLKPKAVEASEPVQEVVAVEAAPAEPVA